MRTPPLLERLGLAVLGGTAFAFVASTTAPGLQRLVAGAACPRGTDEAYVVRVPHDPDPASTVRSSPLVCVDDGVAAFAPEWRTLPLLLGLGIAATLAVLVVVALAARLVRRLRADTPTIGAPSSGRQGPPPYRTGIDDVLRAVLLLVGLPFALATAGVAWGWLALDTPYRVSSCSGQGGGSATCFDGEPVLRWLTLLFGLLTLASLLAYAYVVRRSMRRRSLAADLWRDGHEAAATLVEVRRTHTTVNGARVQRFTYEVAATPGTPPFRFTEHGTTSPAGGVGGRAQVLYDPLDTSRAMVVDPALVDAPSAV